MEKTHVPNADAFVNRLAELQAAARDLHELVGKIESVAQEFLSIVAADGQLEIPGINW